MKRIGHIIARAAVLLLALSAASCVQPLPEHSYAELMVSLYVPDILTTKAETGPVNPTEAEKEIKSLQVWVFLHDENGSPVSYKAFTKAGLAETGLGNASVTRFGLPLSADDFSALTTPGATVDVYAVANADPTWGLDGTTSRAALDAAVLSGDVFGVNANTGAMTTSVPETGLPMTGVLKDATVTGGYPVLNISKLTISNLTLTRAVSKIRFVFVQQGQTVDNSTDLVPLNEYCSITRIVFDGGDDCQIAAEEYLFTESTSAIKEYMPLSATLPGLSNDEMASHDDPESLTYRSDGHEGESAQAYETRLDAAIAAMVATGKSSQVGPVYIRETEKVISGTIYYKRAQDGQEQPAHFTMESTDNLSRNHSWIVYAYFAEESQTLELTVTVAPWATTQYQFDHTDGSVNVVRRFMVFDTDPQTFRKVQTSDGFFNVAFWHTVDGQTNEIKGDIIIATPVNGILHIQGVPGRLGFVDGRAVNVDGVVNNAFIIEPQQATIYPDGSSSVEDCRIEFTFRINQSLSEDVLEGQYIDVHFYVEYGDREIDLGSESRDFYRFIVSKNWQTTDWHTVPDSEG